MKRLYFQYIIALCIFGSNGVIVKNIPMKSYELVFLRTVFGLLFLIATYLILKGKFSYKDNKQDTLYVTISGVIMGMSGLCLFEAYQQIGVSISSLLFACGPIIVMALSPFLFHEKLTKEKVLGFVTVLAGIILINGSITSGAENRVGIYYGLMSAVFYAFMIIFNKKAEQIHGMENAILQLLASLLPVGIYLLIRQGPTLKIPSGSWIWIIILGFVNTGIGCYLYFDAIKKLPVQTVSIWGYLEHLMGVVFATLFLQERMSTSQIIGAVLIIGRAVFSDP